MQARERTLAGTLAQIRQGLALGIERVDFFGGEPTMYPFLKKAMVFAQRNGLKCSLATNGIRFSSEKYSREFFKGFSPEGTRTTLHSHRPEVHDRITCVPGSWEKTVKGIRNILLFEKKLTVNIVINRLNYQELPAWTRFMHESQVLGVKYSALQHTGGALACQDLWVKDREYEKGLLDAVRLASSLGFYLVELERIPERIVRRMCAMKLKVISHQ